MTFEIVETFKHRNRRCVIVRHTMKRYSIGDEVSHNGYVTVAGRNHGIDYTKAQKRIDTECLTWAGPLHDYGYHDHQWFLGFDTMHSWNDEVPDSKTYASVKAKTIELADEMVEKGI